MATYLITSQEVKSNTSLGGNVDSDNIMHLIYDTQIMVIEPILGTKLYDKLITDFIANDIVDEYETMFDDYVKPVLWHSVYAAYLREGNVIAKNGGVFTNQPDNATATDLEALKYVSKNAQSKADVYISRLERFLCDQNSNIPEYTQTQDNDYDIKPRFDVNTVSGWYFGNGSGAERAAGGGGGSEDALLLE
jgi:hypothetical protein